MTVVVPNTGTYSDSSNLIAGSLLIIGGLGITLRHYFKKERQEL